MSQKNTTNSKQPAPYSEPSSTTTVDGGAGFAPGASLAQLQLLASSLMGCLMATMGHDPETAALITVACPELAAHIKQHPQERRSFLLMAHALQDAGVLPACELPGIGSEPEETL